MSSHDNKTVDITLSETKLWEIATYAVAFYNMCDGDELTGSDMFSKLKIEIKISIRNLELTKCLFLIL